MSHRYVNVTGPYRVWTHRVKRYMNRSILASILTGYLTIQSVPDALFVGAA